MMLFCPLRREHVACKPEEVVRQKLIYHMIENLAYPKHTLLCERAFSHLPHLVHYPHPLPDCRLDLVCLASHIHSEHALYPLLLIECKKVASKKKAKEQLIGYNFFVGAYFLTLADENGIETGYYDSGKKEYSFFQGLPSYGELLKNVQ